MNIIPFGTMRDIDNLRREINRVYGAPFSFFEDDISPRITVPFIDIYETETAMVITCDLPGLQSKEDVNISVENNVVTISGTIDHEQGVKENNYLKKERFRGQFRRSISLPINVSGEDVKAVYKNGVLIISCLKVSAGTKRSIDIDFSH